MAAWEEIDQYLTSLGVQIGAPTPGQTTGGTHVSGSLHYQGRARDYGSAGSDMLAVYNALVPFAQGPDYQIEELFYDPAQSYDSGQPVGPIGGHSDHVHAALRVDGHLSGAGARTYAGAATQGASGPVEAATGLLGAVGGGIFGPLLGALGLGALGGQLGRVISGVLGGTTLVELSIRTVELLGGGILLAAGALIVVGVVAKGTPNVRTSVRARTRRAA